MNLFKQKRSILILAAAAVIAGGMFLYGRKIHHDLHNHQDGYGHGLCIYQPVPETHPSDSGRRIVAFVEGLDWYHGESQAIRVLAVPADEQITEAELADVKTQLSACLKPKCDFCQDGFLSKYQIVANG